MKRIASCVVSTLLLLGTHDGFSELTAVDGPYPGNWPPGWSREARPLDVVVLLGEAQTVCLAEVKQVKTLSSDDSGRVTYDMIAQPTRVLKGPTSGALAFRWVCWFPYVVPGKDILLFTKQSEGKTVLLLARTAYYKENHGISLYDVEDLPTDLVVDVLSYLLSRSEAEHSDRELALRLTREYRSGKWRSDKACVCLAAACGCRNCVALLKTDVSRKLEGQWDCGRYEVSARALVKLEGVEGIRFLLDSLTMAHEGGAGSIGRWKEQHVFYYAAEAGAEAVGPIQEFAQSHPKYLASAMGAMGQIGGERAKLILRQWLVDKDNWERSDTIRCGGDSLALPLSAFAARALVLCKDAEGIHLLKDLAHDPEVPEALRNEAAKAVKQVCGSDASHAVGSSSSRNVVQILGWSVAPALAALGIAMVLGKRLRKKRTASNNGLHRTPEDRRL